MFLVGIMSWWYGSGWIGQLGRVRSRLTGTASFFSIGQLAGTLFSPFRQISAESSGGPAAVQLRAFFDKTLSRVIGAIVRLFTIFAGIVTILFQALFELIIVVMWLVLPLFPVIGFIAFAIGWVPQWI